MGGGPDREQMLIVLWTEEPKEIIAKMRERFPYIEIKYWQIESVRGNSVSPDAHGSVPEKLWNWATIVVTLAVLPATAKSLPNCKFIHLFSAGIDSWTKHPIITDSTIPITTCSGVAGPPIAEWITMMTLVASKHYDVTREAQKAHQWGVQDQHLRETTDWVGRRVGIAGYGSIGRQAARMFHALGAEVLAYTASPRLTDEARKDQGYYVKGTGDPDGEFPTAWYSGTKKSDLHNFLRQDLDLLVMSLPLTPGTMRLMGKEEFAILAKRKAFVVNISRGRIFDQDALIEALNGEKLRGAALDVTDPEPLPEDSPLWDAKNTIITPHVSAMSDRYAERAYDVLFTNLVRREKGMKMFNVVNRKRGY